MVLSAPPPPPPPHACAPPPPGPPGPTLKTLRGSDVTLRLANTRTICARMHPFRWVGCWGGGVWVWEKERGGGGARPPPSPASTHAHSYARVHTRTPCHVYNQYLRAAAGPTHRRPRGAARHRPSCSHAGAGCAEMHRLAHNHTHSYTRIRTQKLCHVYNKGLTGLTSGCLALVVMSTSVKPSRLSSLSRGQPPTMNAEWPASRRLRV